MRGLALLVVVGCGGVPEVPARLEEVGLIPELFQDTPAAFDSNDRLVLMDGGGAGLRRLNGTRLDVVPGTANFSFGSIGIDRDGTLLLGSFGTLQLVRLEPNDALVQVGPTTPISFTGSLGTPSGAYHVLPFGEVTTLVLDTVTATWIDSMRKLDRTLWAPDGTIYAIIDGDVVRLAADDAAVVIASCAEFGGGLCFDLELAGTDANGDVHMAIRTTQEVHILDPDSGTYRHVGLPGALRIEAMAAGAAMSVVIAVDPERSNQRSLWMLGPNSDELLRFAALPDTLFGQFIKVIADRAGNVYLIADGKLQAVVPN